MWPNGKESLHSLPEDSVLSVIDFAENYNFGEQNEVQEAHWDSLNVNILVHIIYHLNPVINPNRKETWLLKEIHFYILDDGKHDTLFVQYCLLLHWNQMTKGGFTPTQHYVWSDGCVKQFKSAWPFYFVSRYLEVMGDVACYGLFLGLVMGKGNMMGLALWWSECCGQNNWTHMGIWCEILKMWVFFKQSELVKLFVSNSCLIFPFEKGIGMSRWVMWTMTMNG